MKAVIMAGGVGSRLWPISRKGHPKQFLSFTNEGTMLQQTVKRLSGLPIDSSVAVCNEEHRFFVAEQLREIEQSGEIILEPVSRNTAPAVALAAITEELDDPLLLVLASDHVIADVDCFTETVKKAISLAEQGKLVMFGITPSEPNSGYGYIKAGKSIGDGFRVEAFEEKPDTLTAERFLKEGNYYWNSGMFLFKASRYLDELKSHRPDMYSACAKAVANAQQDLDFIRVDPELFATCCSESIDCAVMEHTSEAVVFPMDAGWNDIGSWSSIWAVTDKDQQGNAVRGDVIIHNSKNSYLRSEDKLIAAVGVDDLVVVSTKDALLVAHKDSVQDIKLIPDLLRDGGRNEWELHREVYRPWGKFDSIDTGDRYKVKRITVNPGAKLSVQMHHHRSEHWVIVSGTAMVTNGDQTVLLSENESTYIPVGVVHALENPGKLPLEIIEVQTGSYLDEDDIVRFEDRYGRIKNEAAS